MAYDEHAVALVQQMEEIIERAGVDESVRRCGAILNAVELLVEEDEPPRNPEVLRLIGAALMAQADVAGVDRRRLSATFDQLTRHSTGR